MATSLSDLIAQKETLERQIRDARAAARAQAIAEVREIMATHGLEVADLTGASKAAKVSDLPKRAVAAKYRDEVTGATWSGRGLKPKWLVAAIESGKTLQDFVI